ncbi:hypothetical protein RJ641_014153, partial [Dillenia turbinata]
MAKKFLSCMKEGSWIRASIRVFYVTKSWENFLLYGSMLVDIPLVDQSFHDSGLADYEAELKTIGVMFEYGDACKYIGEHLICIAASLNLTARN